MIDLAALINFAYPVKNRLLIFTSFMTDTVQQPSFPRKRETSRLTSFPTQWDNTAITALSATRRLFDKLDSRLHPQGVRCGCKGLKPQQRTLRGNDYAESHGGKLAVCINSGEFIFVFATGLENQGG